MHVLAIGTSARRLWKCFTQIFCVEYLIVSEGLERSYIRVGCLYKLMQGLHYVHVRSFLVSETAENNKDCVPVANLMRNSIVPALTRASTCFTSSSNIYIFWILSWMCLIAHLKCSVDVLFRGENWEIGESLLTRSILNPIRDLSQTHKIHK